MTDRELLELAAKAAGVEHDGYTERYYDPGLRARGNAGDAWNPLTDDGDALRLAVKTGVFITGVVHENTPVRGYRAAWNDGTKALYQRIGSDAAADYRRAIVRAAAAIGKEMS